MSSHGAKDTQTHTTLFHISNKSPINQTQPSKRSFVQSVLVRPQQCQKHILIVAMGVMLHCLLKRHAVTAFVHLLDYLEVHFCTGGHNAVQGTFFSTKLVDGEPDYLLKVLLGTADQTDYCSQGSKEIILWVRFQILIRRQFMC
jgi:hypothetical protein